MSILLQECCSAGAVAISPASNTLVQSPILTVYLYSVNKSTFILLSQKYSKIEMSILLKECMQLQCLQICRMHLVLLQIH